MSSLTRTSLGPYEILALLGSLVVKRLPTGARKVVQAGGYYGRYVGSGHLAYILKGIEARRPHLHLQSLR